MMREVTPQPFDIITVIARIPGPLRTLCSLSFERAAVVFPFVALPTPQQATPLIFTHTRAHTAHRTPHRTRIQGRGNKSRIELESDPTAAVKVTHRPEGRRVGRSSGARGGIVR